MVLTKLMSLFIGISFVLTSCATYNKESCAEKNWLRAGYENAAKGFKADRYAIQECSSFMDKTKMMDQYSQGYAAGLEKFCTYEFGLYWGRQGSEYRATCPKSLENKFLAGYSQGKLDYDKLQIEQKNVDSQVEANQAFTQALTKNKCTFDSDCEKAGHCEYNLQKGKRFCLNSSHTCTFDSDCATKGKCDDSYCQWH